jgi:hypothetical protein
MIMTALCFNRIWLLLKDGKRRIGAKGAVRWPGSSEVSTGQNAYRFLVARTLNPLFTHL